MKLRRGAAEFSTLELKVGGVVLAITAVLVATATPNTSEMAHSPAQSTSAEQP